MNTRIDQINWLKLQADTISYYDSTNSSARELIKYWEENEEMPKWYDEHDHILLIELVENLIKDENNCNG
jgi:hypothetical protein